MNGITAALVAALCIGIVTLVVAMIARFLGKFNEETRRIADKMRRAQDSDEYIYWQSRLRRHYIRLLPFVSEKTAGRIYSRLFRKPKHYAEKRAGEEHGDGLFHILAPSVLSLCLCAICLCGMSWAWFTATGNTDVSKITAATYTVDVTVTQKTGEGSEEIEVPEKISKNVNGKVTTVTFNESGEYTVTLTANGTANYGRYLVTMNSTEYMSGSVLKNGNISFPVKAGANDQISITPVWTDKNGELPTEYKNVTYTDLNSELYIYILDGYEESDSNEEPATKGQETVATTQIDDTTDIVNSTNSVVATTAQTTTAATAKEEAEATSDNNSSQATGANGTQKEDTKPEQTNTGSNEETSTNAGETNAAAEVTTSSDSASDKSTNGNAGSGSQTGGAETTVTD